jgi:hypothetical protein
MRRPAFVHAAYLAVSEKTSPKHFKHASSNGRRSSTLYQGRCFDPCDPSGGGDPFAGSPSNTIVLDSNSLVAQYASTGAGAFIDNAQNKYLTASFDGSSLYNADAPQDGIATSVPAVAPTDVPRDQWVELYGSNVYISGDDSESWLITPDGHHAHLIDNPTASEIDVVDQDASTTYAVPYAWLSTSYQTASVGGTHMEAAGGGRGVTIGVIAAAALNGAYNAYTSPATKFFGLAGPWGRALAAALIVGAGAVAAYKVYRSG